MARRKRASDAIVRKADGKLGYVAQLWSSALGACCTLGEEGVLERELVFPRFGELPSMRLAYSVSSKLFATLFDLVCSFDVPGQSLEGGEVSLLKDATGFRGSAGAEDIAEALSNSLVLDRVQDLGVTRLRALCLGDGEAWHVEIQQLVGSSTWNLLPPVLQLIEPRPEECVKGTELARMVAAALADRSA